MISNRELERIERQSEGSTYFSIETEILNELIEVYKQFCGIKSSSSDTTKPNRNRKTDD